mgnify:CR=1 FL=1
MLISSWPDDLPVNGVVAFGLRFGGQEKNKSLSALVALFPLHLSDGPTGAVNALCLLLSCSDASDCSDGSTKPLVFVFRGHNTLCALFGVGQDGVNFWMLLVLQILKSRSG